MSFDPLHQFEVVTFFNIFEAFGLSFDFTNSALYMLMSVAFCFGIFYSALYSPKESPGKMQTSVEFLYDFISSMLRESIASKKSGRYAPFVLSVFLFVLFCNIIGMLPFPMKFTATSHISVTLFLSLVIFIFATVLGIKEQKGSFFNLFLPKGTPLWLAPMMVLIELFAYISRPVSLSVRLAANMIAGHTILEVISNFVVTMESFFSVLPFIFVIVLVAFEFFIAILQAYIFAILTCVYLSDSLDGH